MQSSKFSSNSWKLKNCFLLREEMLLKDVICMYLEQEAVLVLSLFCSGQLVVLI